MEWKIPETIALKQLLEIANRNRLGHIKVIKGEYYLARIPSLMDYRLKED